MPKLSKEAWILAFYDVMKETPPRSKASLKKATKLLQEQQVKAGNDLKEARQSEKTAQRVADDLERKRYQAGVELDELRRTVRTEEGMRSAQRDYDEAAERARRAQAALVEAHSAVRELDFRSKALEGRLKELEKRSESGQFDDLDEELAEVMMQAELGARLEREDEMVSEAAERVRQLESDLHEAKSRRDVREAERLEQDLAWRREVLVSRESRRDAVAALMPGYEIAAVQPSEADKLKDQSKLLANAAKAANQHSEERKKQAGESREKQRLAADLVDQAAAKDPKLKAACESLAEAQRRLAERRQAVLGSTEALSTLQARYQQHQRLIDLYASGGKGAPDGKAVQASIDVAGLTADHIGHMKGELRTQQDQVRESLREVATLQQSLQEAIRQRVGEDGVDPQLAQALKALQLAEDELRRAEAAQRQAEGEAAVVAERALEAKRRLTVVQTLSRAQVTGDELSKAVRGVEDFPIWESSSEVLNQLGTERYDKLVKLGHDLTNEYQTLVDNGATIEELREVYKNTPEKWLPPRFREEEQNWVSMHALLDAETEDKFAKEEKGRLAKVNEKIESFKSKLESGESLAGKVVKGVDYGEKGLEILGKVSETLKHSKELAEKFESVLGLAAKMTTVLQAPLKALEKGGEAMETEDPVEALMLQDEFMEALGELVGGLTDSVTGLKDMDIGGVVVKQMAALLPGIGVAVNFADVMKGMVEAATRIDEAIQDAESHAVAVADKHRGETAIDQFARRDKHLAARASAKTGAAMIKAAGSVVELSGVGVAVGKGMQTVASGIGGVQTVVEQIVDRGEGEKARQLLDRAQAGDGHARSELFRYHPRYAKGILAIMADEGDALALRVLATHGLTEAMIRRSSPKIVKRYLMKKFGESDDPPSWTGLREAVSEKLESAGRLLDRIDGFLDNLADKLIVKTDKDLLIVAQATLSDAAYQLTAQADVAQAMSDFIEVRMRRDALAEKAGDDEGQAKDLQALDLALAAEAKKVTRLRQKLLASLDRVRTVLSKVLGEPASPLRDKAEAAARQALREHMVRIDSLASVG